MRASLTARALGLTLLSLAGCSVLIDARFREEPNAALCVDIDDASPCEPLGLSGEFICVAGACKPSSCGDGFVDARRAELCDDANAVSGDGCEPFDCVPSCTLDVHCDDDLPCNGVESCTGGACAAGTPLGDGASCGAERACRGGICASLLCGNMDVDEDEDCDDGNTTNGDGCENDCTFTCEDDDDCRAMDADVCDGSDTCDVTTHTCEAGEPLVCDDMDPCTADSCDPLAGCVYDGSAFDTDGDGFFSPSCGGDDCDDSEPTTFPGAPEICADGVDNDCVGGDGSEPINYYPDCDRDGYASLSAAPLATCLPPNGAPPGCSSGAWVTRVPTAASQDCRDDLQVVAPGAGFAETPIPGEPSESDFDYNCDGREELAFPVAGAVSNACSGLLGSCQGASHWTSTSAPACGSQASLSVCRAGLLNCMRATVNTTVACR